MATSASDLIERVRANINEAERVEDPARENWELLMWLTDGLMDYTSKIPGDAFPELIKQASATGNSIPIPSDYIKTLQVKVTHSIPSGTATEIASILEADEEWLLLNHPVGMGAVAIFRADRIDIGPNATSGILTYQKSPTPILDPCGEFPLSSCHENAIVDYATAKALAKLQDAGAEIYMGLYNARVQAEQGRYGAKLELERTP